MKKPASSSLDARLAPRKRHSTEVHDERVSSFVEVVNFLLVAYETKNKIDSAIKELEFVKEFSKVYSALYAKRLFTKVLGFGIVYEENCVKVLFIKGRDEAVCDNMRVYSGQQPRAPLTELARFADTLIKIADRSVRWSGEQLKYRTAEVASRPFKLSSYALIGNEKNDTIEAASTVSAILYNDSRRESSPRSSD